MPSQLSIGELAKGDQPEKNRVEFCNALRQLADELEAGESGEVTVFLHYVDVKVEPYLPCERSYVGKSVVIQTGAVSKYHLFEELKKSF